MSAWTCSGIKSADGVSIAPHGKEFALLDMSQQIGGRVLPRVLAGRWLMRSSAERAQAQHAQATAIALLDEISVTEDRS